MGVATDVPVSFFDARLVYIWMPGGMSCVSISLLWLPTFLGRHTEISNLAPAVS